MELVLNLSLDHASDYYKLFFLLAFVLSSAIIIIQLKAHKFLNGRYFVALAAASLAFVVGCKLLPFFDFYFNQPVGNNTIILGQMTGGGIVLGLLVILLIINYLSLSYKLLDFYAYALFASLALQKLGCLLGGCCYGIGDGLIKVNYAGGIVHNALPVYQIIAYLMLLFIGFKLRKYRLAAGSIAFMGLAAYALLQFIVEFYKTPITTLAFAQTVAGIKILQWIYLLLFFTAAGLLFLNEHSKKRIKEESHSSSLLRTTIVFCLTLFTLILVKDYLYRTEIYAVNISLTPALAFIVARFYYLLKSPYYRLGTIALIGLPLFLMSQTVIRETSFAPDSVNHYGYHSLAFGAKGGNAHNKIIFDTDPGSCGGIVNSSEFDHSFQLLGIGYSYTKVAERGKMNNRTEFGLNASLGQHTETPVSDLLTEQKINIFDVNPFIFLDNRWAGAKFGAHIGNTSRLLTKGVYEQNGIPQTGLKVSSFIPQMSLRLGPRDIIYIEYNYASHFINALPEIPQDIAFGSGFGLTDGTYGEFGISISSENSFYFSAYVPIKQKFVIQPLIRFGEGTSFMLGAQYRFGQSEIRKSLY